jgi:hypothetical protein
LLLLAALAAHCFTITKRRAEKFSHDCSAFATIILLYRLLFATIMKQELPVSIFSSTSAIKALVPIYQSTWSHTPEELYLHEQCCMFFRCHVGQKILLIKACSTPTSVDANRYVILYRYRTPLFRYWVLLKLQGRFNFRRPNFFSHITLSVLNINFISL